MASDVAWSPIHYSDDLGNVTVIEIGEKVSASDVGGDDEFNAIKAAGAIREVDYPEDIASTESPRERNIRVIAEKMEEIQAAGYDMSDLDLVPLEVPTAAPGTEEVETPKKSAAKSSGASGDS